MEGAIGMAYGVRSIAACYDIPVRAPYPASIRKHFCGQVTASQKRGRPRTDREASEDRAATKAMVIARARQLGYLPRDCFDDDRADVAAIFDYASHLWGRKNTNFEMFA